MDLPVPVYNLSVYQKALEVLITEDAEMAVTSVRRAMLADFKPVREVCRCCFLEKACLEGVIRLIRNYISSS